MKTLIIAEAGSNHNKNYAQAISLIDVAKESGADVVKFQSFTSETVYNLNTPNFANYQNINDLVKSLEMPREWQPDLKKYCDSIGIEFMSTPFDEKSTQDLVDIGVRRIKVAGFESTDLRFIDMVASTKLPLIISAGIGSNVNFIQKIIDVCHNQSNHDVTILHCNNAYPTPQKDINLGTLIEIQKKYVGLKTGFSDHTLSPFTPALAVALGATVVEKHYTLSKKLHGPDHPFALEPNELKEMVSYVRMAETSMGVKVGTCTESEENFNTGMRSIIAKKQINIGDVYTHENITTIRPYLKGNIPASEWFSVLNKKATKNYCSNEYITSI